MTAPAPQIEILRDGPFYRLVVPEGLPQNWSRPSTYTSHTIAALGAKLLAEATGWPVVDLTGARG